MIKLGNTLDALYNCKKLTHVDCELLYAYTCEVSAGTTMIGSDPEIDNGLYLLEDSNESFEEMMYMIECEDIRTKEPENFDYAQFLSKDLAVMGICTDNDGGPTFVITKQLIEKYPNITWQIEHALDWLSK
jgi:hypothetical protein